VVLILVLACLGVAAAISVIVVQQLFAEREVVRWNQRRSQAAWLAEAGIERAASRLVTESTYTGETWNIRGDDFANGGSGRVTIQVAPIAEKRKQYSIVVHSEYLDIRDECCRAEKRVVVDRDAAMPSQQINKGP
jgi:type II secretory pathway component PulK